MSWCWPKRSSPRPRAGWSTWARSSLPRGPRAGQPRRERPSPGRAGPAGEPGSAAHPPRDRSSSSTAWALCAPTPGIDHSNVGLGSVRHCRKTGCCCCPKIRMPPLRPSPDCLQEATGARLGVLIIDLHGRAWRLGTVGVAIGLAGLPGLVDLARPARPVRLPAADYRGGRSR